MNHKYGFHCNRTGFDILDAHKRLKPAVVKVLDPNIDFLTRLRAANPDVFIIGRIVVSLHEQERFEQDPVGEGRAFADRLLRMEASNTTFQNRPLLDAWESYNEIFPESTPPEKMRKYDDFQVAFGQKILAAGLQPVGMNFANGNMLGHHFVNYFPGTLETYTYLGFHEYDWPTMWRLHQENIEQKNEGGMWLTLRYRRIMPDVRRVYGNKHVAIITECGMTQAVMPGHDDIGWLAEPVVSEDSYWRSLMWYNSELMKDDYVKAALLFVVGAAGGWPKWESFEHLGGIVNRLEAYQNSAPPAPTPTPPVTPTPEPPTPTPSPATLQEALLAEAARRQVIQFNPNAALQKRIFADGFVPNSPEFEVDFGGVRYVGQRAEDLQSGQVRVYYVRSGDWGNVAYHGRDSGPALV
jgi:hypothetical protein